MRAMYHYDAQRNSSRASVPTTKQCARLRSAGLTVRDDFDHDSLALAVCACSWMRAHNRAPSGHLLRACDRIRTMAMASCERTGAMEQLAMTIAELVVVCKLSIAGDGINSHVTSPVSW